MEQFEDKRKEALELYHQNNTAIKCVMCGTQTEEAKDIVITSTIQGREIVITGLTGTRFPECGEQYVDSESSKKALKVENKFRKLQ